MKVGLWDCGRFYVGLRWLLLLIEGGWKVERRVNVRRRRLRNGGWRLFGNFMMHEPASGWEMRLLLLLLLVVATWY